MDFDIELEKLKPYGDSDVPEVMKRVLKDKQFFVMLSSLFDDVEDKIEKYKQIDTIKKFQQSFSHVIVRKLLTQTSDSLTCTGIDKLNDNKAYLFIANHRDIVLDSSFMQILLMENGLETTQITFSTNLMHNDFIKDLGKLNKMFTFYRGGSKIQAYKNALLHSKYIRKVISKENESLWIAQRDGRTKDGNDKTQEALIKMLVLKEENVIEALKELNIVPVTISYEYEPCDIEKVQETYIKETGTYKKQQGEDFKSILTGIKAYKGRINMHFGTPLNSFLDMQKKQKKDDDEIIKSIVNEIDKQIWKNYKLFPNNYIASDILQKTNKFYEEKKYNKEQKSKFIDYVNSKITQLKGDKNKLEELFLSIYANPVYK